MECVRIWVDVTPQSAWKSSASHTAHWDVYTVGEFGEFKNSSQSGFTKVAQVWIMFYWVSQFLWTT